MKGDDAEVFDNGQVSYNGTFVHRSLGVRPALWVQYE